MGPSRKSVYIHCSLNKKFGKIDVVRKCGLDFGSTESLHQKTEFFYIIDFAEFFASTSGSVKAVIRRQCHCPWTFLHIGHSLFLSALIVVIKLTINLNFKNYLTFDSKFEFI